MWQTAHWTKHTARQNLSYITLHCTSHTKHQPFLHHPHLQRCSRKGKFGANTLHTFEPFCWKMTLHNMFDTTATIFISAKHNREAINPVPKCGNFFRSVLWYYWKPLWKPKITKNGCICCWYCLYFYIMNIHAIRICDNVRQENVPACILSHLLSEYLKHDPHVLVLMQKKHRWSFRSKYISFYLFIFREILLEIFAA